jgi:hypothetical protein
LQKYNEAQTQKKEIHLSWPTAAELQNICSEGQLDEAAPKKTALN